MTPRQLTLSLIVLAVALPMLLGSGGRIPIYQKTTISAPGHYYVTNDIEIATDYAIRIDTHDVVLDLNGFTLSSTDWGRMVLLTENAKNVTVRNGRILDGTTAVYGETINNKGYIRVEDVEIRNMTNRGISLANTESTDIRRCSISDTGVEAIYVSGPDDGGGSDLPVVARIVDNLMTRNGRGIFVGGIRAGKITDNILNEVGNNGAAVSRRGIHLASAGLSPAAGGRVVIAGNSLHCADVAEHGIYVESWDHGLTVRDNAVANCDPGVQVNGMNSMIAWNDLSDNRGHGLVANGRNNLVDNNVLAKNGDCGLQLPTGGTGANAYRNNLMLDNVNGAVCGTVGTDAGGNIVP